MEMEMAMMMRRGDVVNAYEAAIREDWEKMKTYYTEENYPSLGFPMSVNGDTPIHMAVYSKGKQPLQHLLEVPRNLEQTIRATVIRRKNDMGNTPLHTAAYIGNYEAAKLFIETTREILGGEKTRELLEMTNNQGETALFKAAWYGHTKVMKFLASLPGQMTRDKKLASINRQRNTTKGKLRASILQVTVEGEYFETALALLDLDRTLAEDDDTCTLSSLQRMANLPGAFKSGYKMGFWESILYICIPVFENSSDDDIDSITDYHEKKAAETQELPRDLESGVPERDQNGEVERFIHLKASKMIRFWRFLFQKRPELSKLHKLKRHHKFAVKLANILIKRDDSWKHSLKEESSLRYRSTGEHHAKPEQRITADENEIALFTATRRGIIEIVREILHVHPQAVEYCSPMRQNILHVAVLHRRKEIFDLVKTMKVPLRTLVEGIDKNGYTILHCAADVTRCAVEIRLGPAYQLQDELKWFKRVKRIMPSHFSMHRNNNNKSANELFKEQHKEQLKDAQQWTKETAQACSAVAILLATVVFTAAYTIPGGSNEKGRPNFLSSPLFTFFIIMDVFSFASSLTAIVVFLSLMTSTFKLDDFHHTLPRKLELGFVLLFLSVATAVLPSVATILLIILSEHRQWTIAISYTVALAPASLMALAQFPFHVTFTTTLKKFFKVIRKKFAWFQRFRFKTLRN